jgi:hypothetical protein
MVDAGQFPLLPPPDPPLLPPELPPLEPLLPEPLPLEPLLPEPLPLEPLPLMPPFEVPLVVEPPLVFEPGTVAVPSSPVPLAGWFFCAQLVPELAPTPVQLWPLVFALCAMAKLAPTRIAVAAPIAVPYFMMPLLMPILLSVPVCIGEPDTAG